MPDTLTSLPSDDAPMSEWTKPLSALCNSRRSRAYEGLGYFTERPANSTAERRRKDAAVLKRGPRQACLTDAQRHTICRMRRQGFKSAEIAEEAGCSPRSVERVLGQEGLTRERRR